MSRILPLPPDAISGIQSSKHITTLQSVVMSLFENSLDAGSSTVEIRVDFRRGGCTVEDNGDGIPSSEFEEAGGLGNLYHSSKHVVGHRHELHGSSGSYLSSLGALSLLSITSKVSADRSAATLTIHQGKPIARHFPAPQSHDLTLAQNHGTKVTVRDLFGNMPVRVKQRALAAESGLEDEKAWQDLKYGLVALLLAWPGPCSIKIRDESVNNRSLHLVPLHPSLSHSLTEKNLNHLAGGKTKFDLNDSVPVLFQSGIASYESRARWVPLSASLSNMQVKGSICLDPAPTKGCQFISLGIHPCHSKDGYADLYDAVNRLFLNSSFGSLEDESVEVDHRGKDRHKQDRRFKQDGFTRKQLHGRKGVDMWPMFVLQTKFRDNVERGGRVSERDLKAVVVILEAAVWQWLTAHHFRPRKRSSRKRSSIDSSPASVGSGAESGRTTPVTRTPDAKVDSQASTGSTSKKRKITDLSSRPKTTSSMFQSARPTSGDFSTWSRIKSGRHGFYEEIWEGKKPESAPAGRTGYAVEVPPAKKQAFHLPPLEAGQFSSHTKLKESVNSTEHLPGLKEAAGKSVADAMNHASSDDYGSIDTEAMISMAEMVDAEPLQRPANDALMHWTDPRTRQSYSVNTRTGVVLPNRCESGGAPENERKAINTPRSRAAAVNDTLTSAGLPLILSKRPNTAEGKKKDDWLPGFLRDWSNPVFSRQNEEPIRVASFNGPGIDAAEAATKGCTHDETTVHFDQAGNTATRKLSKSALKKARVIRQVDRKFIMCKMRGEDEDVLVLVDQHAASERVILEKLLHELCTPVSPSEAQTTGSKVRTVYLDKPLRFQTPSTEVALFERHAAHFANWGIVYSLHERTESLSASQVRAPKPENTLTVRALPPGIAERCTLAPKLLIELLRSEIWTAPSSAGRLIHRPTDAADTSASDKEGEASHTWLSRLSSCPKRLLDLISSRACRSAIMFNDVLSNKECEDLLRELGECVFPFMCAHGRVSMVPLVELGSVGESHGDVPGSHERLDGFSKSFKQWKASRAVDGNADRAQNVDC